MPDEVPVHILSSGPNLYSSCSQVSKADCLSLFLLLFFEAKCSVVKSNWTWKKKNGFQISALLLLPLCLCPATFISLGFLFLINQKPQSETPCQTPQKYRNTTSMCETLEWTQVYVYRGQGTEVDWKGCGEIFWKDGNVLRLNYDDGSTTLQIY